jgi:hypothetical protein
VLKGFEPENYIEREENKNTQYIINEVKKIHEKKWKFEKKEYQNQYIVQNKPILKFGSFQLLYFLIFNILIFILKKYFHVNKK